MTTKVRTTRLLGAAVAAVLAVGVAATTAGAHTVGGHPYEQYAALGDAYSSGDGAKANNEADNACGSYAAAWSRQLAADSTEILSLDQRACKTATTAQLIARNDGVSTQIPTTTVFGQPVAIPDTSVDLATFTIGANDLGLDTIVSKCVSFSQSCPSPNDPAFTSALSTLKTNLQNKVYPSLRARYPGARIVHVGYPRTTPAPGQNAFGCFGGLSSSDQSSLAGIVTKINDTIKAATDQSHNFGSVGHISYLDITDVLAGHELCTFSPWVAVGGSSGGHPNASGQKAIETLVASSLGITLP